MSIAAAISFAVGTAINVDANKSAQRANKRSGEIQSATQANSDRAALRQQAREARKQRAQIIQVSENLGAGGSSREAGAVADLTQQQATSYANVSAQQLAVAGINRESNKIAQAQTQAGYGQVLQQVGGDAFNKMGGFDSLFKNAGT